jgi:hypothetical protein
VTDFHDRNQSRAQRRTNRPLILVSLLVFVIVAIGTYWFVTQGPGQRIVSPPGSDIAQFSGDGDQTTNSFTVRGQWQVHWENQGDRFRFAIAGDQELGTIIDQSEPGSGVTNVVAAGTFHLQVSADGPWTVRITQGE